MDFFIALIGVIYFVTRYSIEKDKDRKYQIEQDRRNAIYDDFLKNVCDYRVADEIDQKVRDPANAEWVEAETKDVLSMLPDIDPNMVSPKYFHDEKVSIILAKQGHLRGDRFAYSANPKYERKNALSRWICEELARHGLDIVIVRFFDDSSSFHFEPRDYVSDPSTIVHW